MKRYDVLLAGYYGFGNLGDELLAEASVAQLEACGTNKRKIAVLSAKPDETSERLGVAAFNRWSAGTIYDLMKKSKTLLLGGGGLFQDSTSVRSCIYYWGIVRMACLAGARPWAVGQSIGPLRSAPGAYFARSALASCLYRGVRNQGSLGILNNWGLRGDWSPDLVMSLNVNRDYERGDVMLLNLRPGYAKISNLAARHASDLAERQHLRVTGVAFSEGDARELEIHHKSGVVKLEQITVPKTLIEYENILTGSCCAMGMRLHFLVLGLLCGLPMRGVPYDPKVRSFCAEWGIPDFRSPDGCFSQPADEKALFSASEKVRTSFKQGYRLAVESING